MLNNTFVIKLVNYTTSQLFKFTINDENNVKMLHLRLNQSTTNRQALLELNSSL